MIIILFPLTASADDSTLGGTGITVYPIDDTQVVMEEEIIDITVKSGHTYVNCQFFFHNTGEKTDLLVGFPTQYPGGYSSREEFDKDKADNDYAESHITELHRFRTYINGRRAKVTVKKGLASQGYNVGELYFPQWYTWSMTLDADERLKVVNTYWMENSTGGENTEITEYILRSGAMWKGPIGKVTVRMNISEFQQFGAVFPEMPPTYVEYDGTVVWEAENVEPDRDIEAYYSEYVNRFMYTPFENGTPEDLAYEKMGQRLLRNFNAKHYNGVTWWADRFLRKFGDTQSSQFYYLSGVSYYKKGKYDKALNMLNKSDDSDAYTDERCLYYKALIYHDMGDDERYRECLEMIKKVCPQNTGEKIYWITMWVHCRLAELASH